jgi:hypothetical protein
MWVRSCVIIMMSKASYQAQGSGKTGCNNADCGCTCFHCKHNTYYSLKVSRAQGGGERSAGREYRVEERGNGHSRGGGGRVCSKQGTAAGVDDKGEVHAKESWVQINVNLELREECHGRKWKTKGDNTRYACWRLHVRGSGREDKAVEVAEARETSLTRAPRGSYSS